MKRVYCLIFIAFFCLPVFTLTADVAVQGVGRAAGTGELVKEQALADALRDAVRKGAGVHLISSSQATDYILDYDRIFSQAFGYIKSFKIISSGVDNAGLYTVEITAIVGKGAPEMNDYLAMRQIIAMKGAPRLLIRTTGTISGVGDSQALIAGMLHEIALQCGFNVIKLSQFQEAEEQRTRRDKHLGDRESASYRKADIRSNYDFAIDAEVQGAYKGSAELYGVTAQRFALGADLGAAWPNGRAIAQVTVPSVELYISKISDPAQAARSALMQTLGGSKNKNFRALLLRVLSAWVAEFDVGAKVTVELKGVSRELLDQVVAGLKKSEGVNGVNVREFDDQLNSSIEVDSRLKPYDLGRVIAALSNEQLKIDQSTSDYIRMEPFVNVALWLIIGGSVIGLIAILLLFWLIRRKKKN